MNINIRDYIKDNFKNNNKDNIKKSINQAIKENDELTLPGMGVFFEILWNESDKQTKKDILSKLESYFKNL